MHYERQLMAFFFVLNAPIFIFFVLLQAVQRRCALLTLALGLHLATANLRVRPLKSIWEK